MGVDSQGTPSALEGEKQAKVKRASSNPYEHLQSRTGGHGLGYTVPEDEIAGTIRSVINKTRNIGRPRRSPCGKQHDAARLTVYIKSKLQKNTKTITNSLAASAAATVNSVGLMTLQHEKNKKIEKNHNEKRFLFEFCSISESIASTHSDVVCNKLVFAVPTIEHIAQMKFNDIAYIGKISPELLRLLVIHRVIVNKYLRHKTPAQLEEMFGVTCYDSLLRSSVLEESGSCVSEIRKAILHMGVKVLRAVKYRVFSVDPLVNGDSVFDDHEVIGGGPLDQPIDYRK